MHTSHVPVLQLSYTSAQCEICFSLSKRQVSEFGERGRTCVLVYQIGLPASLRE